MDVTNYKTSAILVFFFPEWRRGSFPLLHPSSPSHTRMLLGTKLGIAWDYCVHYVLPLPPKSGIPHVWGQLSSQEKGSQRSQGRSLSEACCRPIWRWRAVTSGQRPVHPRYLPGQPGSASDSAHLTPTGHFFGRHGVRARFSSQLHQAAF